MAKTIDEFEKLLEEFQEHSGNLLSEFNIDITTPEKFELSKMVVLCAYRQALAEIEALGWHELDKDGKLSLPERPGKIIVEHDEGTIAVYKFRNPSIYVDLVVNWLRWRYLDGEK